MAKKIHLFRVISAVLVILVTSNMCGGGNVCQRNLAYLISQTQLDEGNLYIRDIVGSDAGQYTCTVIDQRQRIKCEAAVWLIVSPVDRSSGENTSEGTL